MAVNYNEDDAFTWKSLPSCRLNAVCTDQAFLELANEISSWEPFAYYLKLKPAKITEIQKNNPNDYYSQKLNCFVEWKKQYGSKASYEKLFECLEFFEKELLIEILMPLCNNQSEEGCFTGKL